MTITNKELQGIFEKVGRKHGYKSISTEFAAIKDFKATWERGYGYINLQISDYVKDAPLDAVEGLAERIFSNIEGKVVPHNDAMKEWALSDEFVEKERPIYLKRSCNIKKDPKGKHKDLTDSLKRLADAGLIDDTDVYLTWSNVSLSPRAAYCSALMKTIVVSSALDDNCTPDDVLDYVVYYNWVVMTEARETFGQMMTLEYMEKRKKYPDYAKQEAWLTENNLEP